MVNPDTALRRLLRETGKLLQPYGFHGTEPTWTRVEARGVASVGRTRVTRTWIDGQQVLGFGLTLRATPIAWWEYCTWRDARLGLPPIPLESATGPGLIDSRSLADELTTPWTLRVDPDLPGSHALRSDIDTIRSELPRRVHAYARRALRLLETDRYLDELSDQPDQGIRTREAIVVLLADRGPGPRLDEAVHRFRQCAAESAYPEDAIAYARTRTAVGEIVCES
ncbi:hypothetical protein [Nocardia implantans]|uniref:DUF4304 domain-containing protein n=1 Tax=Nocardia implantans TaxID=3108168 RepID=A0ABU6B0F0_9NOCA|nr:MULTISPECIES: hypothetical protein [unclassified Nocardia]MBF6195309.1 hypothetical protein [Nocardia beijingensis]MEA3530645.1 hypothetical protein [Nocardia sp. CDC192]MEB3513225.1 hypothetical protein [Nocardia sp. CDC186]